MVDFFKLLKKKDAMLLFGFFFMFVILFLLFVFLNGLIVLDDDKGYQNFTSAHTIHVHGKSTAPHCTFTSAALETLSVF